MQNFLRLLKEHGDTHPLPQELVTQAGKLSQDFQHKPVQVLHLVRSHSGQSASLGPAKNADVILVCTQVLIHQEQWLLVLQILDV